MTDSHYSRSLPGAIARLFRQVVRVHNARLKPLGLSAIQAHILAVLWQDGPMPMGQLQKVLALKSSTLTGSVDRMEKNGLIHRQPSPTDRRSITLHPPDWPELERNAVFSALSDTEERLFAGMSASERKLLLELLHRADSSIAEIA